MKRTDFTPQSYRTQHGNRWYLHDHQGSLLQGVAGEFPASEGLGSDRSCDNRRDRIIAVGQVWNSRQNGVVLDVRGIAPTISCGAHSGVEPKIRVVYEVD